MAGKSRWQVEKGTPGGIEVVHLSRWRYFADYINQRMLDYRHFVWRGHASDSWLLESTLDRLLKRINKLHSEITRQNHLNRFKYSTRGRRGTNPPVLKEDN